MKLTVLRISNCNVKGALFKPLVGTLMTIGEVTVSIAIKLMPAVPDDFLDGKDHKTVS